MNARRLDQLRHLPLDRIPAAVSAWNHRVSDSASRWIAEGWAANIPDCCIRADVLDRLDLRICGRFTRQGVRYRDHGYVMCAKCETRRASAAV